MNTALLKPSASGHKRVFESHDGGKEGEQINLNVHIHRRQINESDFVVATTARCPIERNESSHVFPPHRSRDCFFFSAKLAY